jgi:hypothetical protein
MNKNLTTQVEETARVTALKISKKTMTQTVGGAAASSRVPSGIAMEAGKAT